jgi:peptide-methionine (S)-S-oxide reductase
MPVTLHQYYATCDDTNDVPSSTPTVATFAGGCFWGLELAYQREPGVLATCVGYTQGDTTEYYPTYRQVCSEETGHTEAILLVFDSTKVTYKRLADILFDRIPDPTMLNRVGKDRGTQYRTGMYAHSIEQLHEAQTAFERENRSWMISGRPVVTEVNMAGVFWPAEEPHQRYLEKGGRFGRPQSTEKGATEDIRCYG